MQECEQKIRDYGRKADWKSLNEYFTNQGIEHVKNFVKTKINHSDFEFLWTYILRGFTQSEESQVNRFKVVLCCLECLRSKDISSTSSEAIIGGLCLELVDFRSKHLVDLCQLCLEFIQKGDVNKACWSILFPELLNIIVKRELIENCGEEMSGLEYKSQVIRALLFMEWSGNIIIPLTVMFGDLSLTKEEHLEITNKLGKYMDKLTPQEIPTFTYNLLKLCRHQNSKLIFFCLQHYFGTRIYNKNFTEYETNSESLDLISAIDDDEIFQAQSTVLYHIQQYALLSDESFKEYFNFIKNLTRASEFILHPFQLTVLLSISTIAIHKTVVFNIIKQAILRMFQEQIKREESNWLKNMLSETFNLNCIFNMVIEKSVNNCELVLHGLVNLSFVLLGASPLLGRESTIISKQWDLGKYILLKLIQQEVHVAPSVLKKLCEEIVTHNSTFQYCDCFFEFAKRFPVLILENKGYVLKMLESLLLTPGNVSEQILEAIVPLTKPSPTLRDHLILLLRKGLHSRNLSSQTIAIKGFLKLLTVLKISNLTSLTSQLSGSQSSSSGRSVLTQISMNCTVHNTQGNVFSNEALCLEVLGILKRCFTQPYEIKCKLYEGLSEVVSRNSEISEAVLDLLWNYFISKYYVSDEDVCPPIKFKEVSVTREMDVILEEPVGKLLFTIALITIKVLNRDNENLTAKKVVTVLDSIVDRMGKCELVHFELDDGTYLLDVLPESQSKVFVLEQAMTVYEALIGYRVTAWKETSENFAQDINALFQGYFRLQRCAMDAHKSKKEDRKKKDGNKTVNDQTNCSLARTNTSRQNDTNSTKIGVKSNKHIKIPDSIFNFKVVKKFLKILHCNVEFIPMAQLNQIKSKSEIHRHIMQSTINLFQNLKKSKKLSNSQKTKDYENCLHVAKIVYKRCIERMDEFVDFDPITAVLAADCFQIILKLICIRYNDNLSKFLCEVANLEEEKTEFLSRINVFIEKYEKLFEADFTEGTGEAEGKKLQLTILLTLEILIHELPDEATLPSDRFLDWIKTYSTQNTISTKPTVSTFLHLWFTSYLRFKSSLTIFEEIVGNILNTCGSITQDTQGIKTFQLINESTTQIFIEKVSAMLKMMFDHIDLVINRLKSEYSILMYPNVQSIERRKENLKNKERGISCQLCLLITILDSISTILIPIGNLSEAVLKNIISLYNCLNTCAKYFITRSSNINPTFQSARFDRVIKLAGRQLSPSINKFIFYLEETQKENESEAKKKKKSSDILKNKVLCETKSIPKVVYETEQFSRLVTQLSKKTKIDVFKYIGLGTARDFRIKDINNVLRQNIGNETQQTDGSLDRSSVTDESMQENLEESEKENEGTKQNDGEETSDDLESYSESEREEPPSKKMRQ